MNIWNSPCTFFAGTCLSRDHDVIDKTFLLTKPTKIGFNGKIILCWSIFYIELVANSCPFLIYCPSKNESRYHDVKGEPISLTKPTVFGITRKKILCGSKFAIEPIADFCQFRRYWSSKNGSRDYNIKYEFVSLEKTIVFCITGNKSFM